MKASIRTQLITFLVITFIISYSIEYLIIIRGGLLKNMEWVFALMWTPGVIGILCSLVFGHKLKDLGLRLPSFKFVLKAYAYPVMAACFVFLALLVTGISQFEVSPTLLESKQTISGVLVYLFLVQGILNSILGAFVLGLGEELGWRGFLQSRMKETGTKHPYLIIGLIWAAYHLPLIIWSDYSTSNTPLLSAFIFTLVVTSFSTVSSLWMDQSRSIIIPTLMHGVHNAWIQAVYPSFLKAGPLDQYFGGESGLFLLLFYTLTAAWIFRRNKI